jgi:hypothetical protein
VIAALSAWHEQHDEAAAALGSVTVLPAHVIVEAYSVLTRVPSGLAVAPTLAASVLARRFSQPPLQLDERDRGLVPQTLAGAGVFGGASYDGLVALEAKAHRHTLLTLDERARAIYQRLGAPFRVISA